MQVGPWHPVGDRDGQWGSITCIHSWGGWGVWLWLRLQYGEDDDYDYDYNMVKMIMVTASINEEKNSNKDIWSNSKMVPLAEQWEYKL